MDSLKSRIRQSLPSAWLSLAPPQGGAADGVRQLCESAADSGLPIDWTYSPGLWGGFLRGHTGFSIIRSIAGLEHTTDLNHAFDLTQSNLIETLCSMGREQFDAYLIRIRQMPEAFALEGTLQALNSAREQGHVRHVGVSLEGPPTSMQSFLRFNDAFDLVAIHAVDEMHSSHAGVVRLIQDRRALLVLREPGLPSETSLSAVYSQLSGTAWVQLFTVRTPSDVASVVAEAGKRVPHQE